MNQFLINCVHVHILSPIVVVRLCHLFAASYICFEFCYHYFTILDGYYYKIYDEHLKNSITLLITGIYDK